MGWETRNQRFLPACTTICAPEEVKPLALRIRQYSEKGQTAPLEVYVKAIQATNFDSLFFPESIISYAEDVKADVEFLKPKGAEMVMIATLASHMHCLGVRCVTTKYGKDFAIGMKLLRASNEFLHFSHAMKEFKRTAKKMAQLKAERDAEKEAERKRKIAMPLEEYVAKYIENKPYDVESGRVQGEN